MGPRSEAPPDAPPDPAPLGLAPRSDIGSPRTPTRGAIVATYPAMMSPSGSPALGYNLGKPYHSCVKLTECPLRVRSRIDSVNVDPKFDLRLQELGVRSGAEFVAVNRAAFGGVVLNIAGTRVAVDHHSATLIQVDPA